MLFFEAVFDTQSHLHKHIENIHRKSNSKQHPNESVEKKSLEEGKSLILELVENFNEDDALKFLNWIKEEGMETLHRIVLRSIVQNQDHHKIVGLKYENDLANIGITEDFSMDESMDIGSNDLQSHTIEKSNQVEFLKYHIQEEHTCYYCGESFSEQDTFEGHICAIPEGHKDHKCESCGKSFSKAETLGRHIQTVHNGHKCETCDKDYKCEKTY